ncbi:MULTISPECIES: hypothetical protein [Variovorax]|uniref:hypothetical protein n=1 Tax=Variovorax TaxID=34072 RepID=UPI00285AD3BF|nr:hypothetical protein [Variovorax sp. 3319]MDR6890884.1 hypothetical protein [Variovorax sp. 3319]
MSVLMATGLIEAEIEALDPTVRHAASPSATVLRITDDRLADMQRGGLHAGASRCMGTADSG